MGRKWPYLVKWPFRCQEKSQGKRFPLHFLFLSFPHPGSPPLGVAVSLASQTPGLVQTAAEVLGIQSGDTTTPVPQAQKPRSNSPESYGNNNVWSGMWKKPPERRRRTAAGVVSQRKEEIITGHKDPWYGT